MSMKNSLTQLGSNVGVYTVVNSIAECLSYNDCVLAFM